jgi:hypothetical protein
VLRLLVGQRSEKERSGNFGALPRWSESRSPSEIGPDLNPPLVSCLSVCLGLPSSATTRTYSRGRASNSIKQQVVQKDWLNQARTIPPHEIFEKKASSYGGCFKSGPDVKLGDSPHRSRHRGKAFIPRYMALLTNPLHVPDCITSSSVLSFMQHFSPHYAKAYFVAQQKNSGTLALVGPSQVDG